MRRPLPLDGGGRQGPVYGRDSAHAISTKNRASPQTTMKASSGPVHKARRLPTVRTTDARPLLRVFVVPLDLGIGSRDHVAVVGVAGDPVG